MAVSISVLVVITSLHLMAFVLAIGAERRRSTAKVVPDQYDEYDYCVYASDASTVYGLSAFGLLLISQAVVVGVTKCLCCGKGLVRGKSRTTAIFFFVFSWLSFLGAEACLLAGSAKNAYHTKYRGIYHVTDLSCDTLRKGVFAAGAALTFLSMVVSIVYYWVHSKADTGGWEKHQNEEGLDDQTYQNNNDQTHHNNTTFKRHFHSFIGNGPVADVLLWKNTRLSASLLLGATTMWLLFEVFEYNFVSLLCNLTIIGMLIIYITYAMAKYTQWDLPDFEEITIQESTFKWLYKKTNKLLLEFYYTASGEDITRFFLTLATLWMISIIGSHFSSLNLMYLCFLCVGTLPALYERYQNEVDYLVSRGMKDITIMLKQFDSNILSKIPRGHVKGKKHK